MAATHERGGSRRRALVSGLHQLSLHLRAAFVPLVIAFTLTYWRRRQPSFVSQLDDAAIGLLVITAIEWIVTRRTAMSRRREEELDVSRDVSDAVGPSPIEEDARLDWALATWSTLPEGPGRPEVAVLRVGSFGVELLLDTPALDVPAPFRAEAGGFVWRLGPETELEELRSMAISEADPAILVELGNDDTGGYFVEADKVVRARLDDEGDLDDRFAMWANSEGAAFSSPLLAIEGRGEVLLEPTGIVLDAASSPAASGIVVESTTSVPLEATSELRDQSNAPLAGTAEIPPPRQALTAPTWRGGPAIEGCVEARILRESPDLIGELASEVSAAAVEFVAFLCLHGYRSSSARLKEALGTARSRSSRSIKTVWNSAAQARRALGAEKVPLVSGNQLYELDRSVTCDWNRFRALVAGADREGTDTALRRGALVAALSLVDGVPALASQRFSWLDSEGTLNEIALEVGKAGHALARLAEETGDDELRRFAEHKVRMLVPIDFEVERLVTATTPGR
jgi:hypothetical protein